jgi:hypothetical protein
VRNGREDYQAAGSDPEMQNSPSPAIGSESKPPSNRYARKALAASVVGYAMDGFDMLILGFMLRQHGLPFP